MDSVKKWEYDVTHCGVSKHKHHFSPKYGSFKAYIGLVYIRNKSDKIKKLSEPLGQFQHWLTWCCS